MLRSSQVMLLPIIATATLLFFCIVCVTIVPAAQAREQQVISRNDAGVTPNAPVTSITISHDARDARYVAYTTAATNLSPSTDGHQNIYLTKRHSGYGKFGTPWQYGTTALATGGINGAAANGDSWSPALDGSTNGDNVIKPTCLAFVSRASNLVKGDTNDHADVFIRKLSTGKITRIATRGEASSVAVDGRCGIISWIAGGQVYVKAKSKTISMGTRRVSGSRGATELSVSEERRKGFVIVFQRGSYVMASRTGKAAHRVTRGTTPSQDQYGRYVSYQRGGKLYQGNLSGRVKERAAVRSGNSNQGYNPSSTSGGVHIFYSLGPNVYRNVTKIAEGTCPSGNVTDVATSARGNYDVFACSDGNAYLNYVAGK